MEWGVSKGSMKKKEPNKVGKNKGGRPKAEFDLKQVELMGYFKATYETMADYFGVSRETIKRKMADETGEFCSHYKKGNSRLKLKLSEAQIKCAIDKLNPALLIWLGKVHLGQTDKVEEPDGEGRNGASSWYKEFVNEVYSKAN